jgi:hypothetical protein
MFIDLDNFHPSYTPNCRPSFPLCLASSAHVAFAPLINELELELAQIHWSACKGSRQYRHRYEFYIHQLS